MEQVVSKPEINLPFAAPFKLWKAAGLSGLLYVAVIIAAGLFIHQRVEIFATNELFLFLKETSVTKHGTETLLTIARFILWLPVVPVILAALLIPIRIVWIFGKMSLPLALSQSMAGMRTAIVMLYLGSRRLGYVLIPMVAMIFFYFHIVSEGQNAHFINIYLAVCGVLAIPIIWRAAPIIFAVPMAIISQCHPLFALDHGRYILEGKTLVLLLIAILTAIFGIASYQAFYQLPFASAQQIVGVLASLCAAVYCLTGIAIICAQSLTEYQRKIA